MDPRRTVVSVLLIASVAVQMGGCLSSGTSEPGRDTNPPVSQPPASQPGKPTMPKDPDSKRDTVREAATVTGLLRGGIAGIGGEHTGWQLERTGGLPPLEIGIGKVGRAAADKFEGKQVTITGTMIDRKYVERGVVRILRADSIVEAKSQRY